MNSQNFVNAVRDKFRNNILIYFVIQYIFFNIFI